MHLRISLTDIIKYIFVSIAFLFIFPLITDSAVHATNRPLVEVYAQQGGTGNERTKDVAVDASNNVFVFGRTDGTLDIDGDGGIDPYTSAGSNDLFLAKYDDLGNAQWLLGWGNSNDVSFYNNNFSGKIALDSAGNVYIASMFQGDNFDLDATDGTDIYSELGSLDLSEMFIAKYDTDGNYIWGRVVQSADVPNRVNDIHITSSNEIYIGGLYEGATDFNPGVGVDNKPAVASTEGYVTKYDTNGNYYWTTTINGTGTEQVNGIYANSSFIYATGNFTSASYLDGDGLGGGNGPITPTQDPQFDLFVAKYNKSNGSLVDYFTVGDASDDTTGEDIYVDNSGNIYLLSTTQGTDVDYDPGAGSELITTAGGNDTIVAKYNNNMEFVWVKQMGGSGNDFPEEIQATNTAVYISGSFASTVDFDPGVGEVAKTAVGSTDGYIWKLDTSGNYKWVAVFSSSGFDNVYSLRIKGNHVYGANYFQGPTVQLDQYGNSAEISNAGSRDGYYVRYRDVETSRIANGPSGFDLFDQGSSYDATQISDAFYGSNRTIQMFDGSIPIAEIAVDMTDDRDWAAADITAESDNTEYKAYVHNLTNAEGADNTFTLFVPKDAGDSAVFICPGASSLVDVSEDCTDGFARTESSSYVDIVNEGGQDYWKISGLSGTGGISGVFPVTGTNFTIVPNTSDVSSAQEVTVNYIATGEFNIGDTIALDFDTGGDFTLDNCASASDDADGDTTADGAGVGVTNGGPNNDRFLYTFTDATTTASTVGIELCIEVTSPSIAGNYKVDLADSQGMFGSEFYYVGNENLLNVIASVDPTLTFVIRTADDSGDLGNVGGGAVGPNLCNLGNLSLVGVQECSYRLKIGTNAGSGYSVNILTDGSLRNGTNFIANVAENSLVTAGTEGYGIAFNSGSYDPDGAGTVFDPIICTEAGDFNDNDTPTASAITTGINTALYSCAGPNSPLTTDVDNTAIVTHRAEASSSTSAGAYAQLVTYTVSATF